MFVEALFIVAEGPLTEEWIEKHGVYPRMIVLYSAKGILLR